MDNQIPITGFERNIKIDLDGTLLSVPYGYLAGSSRDSATRWMSDEEKIYKGGRFDIYVHAKRKGDSWILEPFNRENKDKFVKALKDGLPMIDTISIQKNSECLLDPKYLKKMMLRYGSKEITSSSKNYKAYERFNEEPFRSGIQSIPRGQTEAALSQGFTYVETMRYIILPQAFRIILPPLINQVVNLIKNTSTVAIISGMDLMFVTKSWSALNSNYIPAFAGAALLYFLLCFPIASWGRRVEEANKQAYSI